MFGRLKKSQLPDPANALPGRESAVVVPESHYVNGKALKGPFPEGLEEITFGLGCFWGAEEIFWQVPGVYSTMVGYTGGTTPNPMYEEVCSGMTGHNEAVRVVFDPARVSLDTLLAVFWEVHDPTQGMQQGNDVGTQYRSGIYVSSPEQRASAEHSLGVYQEALFAAKGGTITTEIVDSPEFFYAEDYHQQYLAKNPMGYRCHANTGVPFPKEALAATAT